MDWNQEQEYSNQAGFADEAKKIDRAGVQLYPHNCVGLIVGKRFGMTVVGTGFLISSNLVLTAAHNLYEHGEWSKGVRFYPGVTQTFSVDAGYDVVDRRLPPQFEQTEKLAYDYALLKLGKNVLREEYIQLGVDYKMQQEEIGVLGYRGERTELLSEETISSIHFSQWKEKIHSVDKNNSYRLLHKLSTFGGNSGGPILVKRKEMKEGKCVAVAIHKGYGNLVKQNAARIITKDVLIDILKWERQMVPSSVSYKFMESSLEKFNENESKQWYESISKRIAAMIEHFKGSKLQGKQQLQISLIQGGSIKITQQQHMKIQQKSLADINKRLQAMSVKEKQTLTSLTIITTVPLLQSKGKGFITQKQSIRKIEQKKLDLEVKLQIYSVNVGRSKKQTAIEEAQRNQYLRSIPVWMKYIKAEEEYQRRKQQMGNIWENSRKSKIKSIKSKVENKKTQQSNNEGYYEYQ